MVEHKSDLPTTLEKSRGPVTVYGPTIANPTPEVSTPAIPLAHFLWIVKRQRWKIVAFVTACVLGTFIISKRLTPIYEATATIDVDQQGPHGIVGPDALRQPVYDPDDYLATQIKLIQSSSVLRPVAMKYHLLRDKNGRLPDPAAPVSLRGLKVTRPPNTYLLNVSYRSPDPALAATVANAIANSYIENTYDLRIRSSVQLSKFMEKQLEELRAKMERSSAALAQFERQLNVINPDEKTNILSARLLQLNTEFTAAQADRVRKEAAFQFVKNGTLEAAQVSTQGDALQTISERLNEANEKFAETRARVGPNHPEYQKWAATVAELQHQLDTTRKDIGGRVQVEYQEAVQREQMLQKELAATKAESDQLNARFFQYKALQQEAEADKKLYEELVQKVKEAGINAGFEGDSIRLADAAGVSPLPVSPNVQLNLLLAFLLSTSFGLAGAFVADMLDTTVRDPDQAQRFFNTDVVGVLPVAPSRRLWLDFRRDSGALSRRRPVDQRLAGYIEAVRTLRNSILLSGVKHRLNSILVTSAAPREGKTTTAVNLAISHAEQHHRTLLLDCDLRRPSVHKYFSLDGNQRGMTNILTEQLHWRDVISKIEGIELDVITAGPPTRRAADLIGKELHLIIEEATKDYDLIVVDSPPMLGFAEPLQMATSVDGVLVITYAGQTNRSAVSALLATLHRLKLNVVGLVLNKLDRSSADGYYYAGYGYYSASLNK